MQLSLVGINHNTASLAIREKVAISVEKLGDSLSLLRSYIPQGVILSTCNRTEIYAINRENYPAEKASLDFMKARASVPDDSLLPYVYVSKDKAAAEHLFRVASGLESMIVGEYEVLGQVKQALEIAEKVGMLNLPLRHVFQSAIRTGRRVRSETGISKNARSVSSVAVDLAAGIVGDLERCKMLVIGTGEAGRLVAKAAQERGISHVVVAGRTQERAAALADQLGGIPISAINMREELLAINLVITCSGAPHPVLDVSHVEETMENRPESPMVIIDIAMPRNVEPEVARIKNVFLYNIDDLTEISNSNRKQREAEIHQAEEMIMDGVNKFASWWQDLEVRPIISTLMSKAEEVRSMHLNKTLKKLPPLSPEQRESLEAMTKSIVAKILKDPIHYLKANGNGDYSEIIKEVFRLNTERHP
ncbi:glutamyl-tRNA reductase [Chloroflexota bacterium]